jgi:cytochrome c oxidase assembly protein subunit 11
VTRRDETDTTSTRQGPKADPVRRGTNRGVVIVCLSALLFMGAATWAAVPLYRIFCQVTGYGGTPMRAEKAPDTASDRTILIRFDANVTPGMPWTFEPAQRMIEVKIGENALAFYRARNTSDHTIKGSASYNVSPDTAGAFFGKIECFCFTEQTLAPGEEVEMPLSFFVDPSIIEDRDARHITEITLSYTFYPVGKDGARADVKASSPGTGG